jgi:hypothetical protein
VVDNAIVGMRDQNHLTNLQRAVDAGKIDSKQAQQLAKALETVAAEKDEVKAIDVINRMRQPEGHIAGESFDVTAELPETATDVTFDIPDSDYDLPDSVLEPYDVSEIVDVGVDKSIHKVKHVPAEDIAAAEAKLQERLKDKGLEKFFDIEEPIDVVKIPKPDTPKTQKQLSALLDEMGIEEWNHQYNPLHMEARWVEYFKGEGQSTKAAKANARARLKKYSENYEKVSAKAKKARDAGEVQEKAVELVHGMPSPVYAHINLVEDPAYAIGIERAHSARLQTLSDKLISYTRDYNPKMLQKALQAEQELQLGNRAAGKALVEEIIENFRVKAEIATGGRPEYLEKMRSPMQIIKDINKSLGQGGEFSLKGKPLTPQQRLAAQRLKRDLDTLKKRAAITGRSVREYLMDSGYSEAVINKTLSKVKEVAPVAEAAQETMDDIRTYFDGRLAQTQDDIRGVVQRAKEFGNTPVVAMRKDPVSKEAIKYADAKDLEKQAFMDFRTKEFARQGGKALAKDMAARERIGMFLDNIDEVGDANRAAHYGLNKQEAELATWMKDEFEDLLWHYGRERLVQGGESAARLPKIVAMAEEGIEPIGLTKAEGEVYDIFRRKFKDYLPHIFDRRTLVQETKAALMIETDPAKITKLEATLNDLSNGKMPLYNGLPEKLRMRFFETRKGGEGYQLDAFKAYNAYLDSIGRKMYDEPVIRHFKANFARMNPDHQPYMAEFARNYMGWNSKNSDKYWHMLRSAEWMRTLGLNPRSALVNLTQQVNTVFEAGPVNSAKAWKKMFTREGAQLWNDLGLGQDAKQAMMVILDPNSKMEKARRVSGFMFQAVEELNRKHAFMAGLEKFAHLKGPERIEKAIALMQKTQFRYGRVGMPMGLQKGMSSVALQFSSYPIKQMELLWHWGRTNPKKLVGYLAAAEGGRWAAGELGDVNVHNQFGFGVDYGEIVKAIKSMSKKEWMNAVRHWRVAKAQGTGILPSGFGPATQAAADVAKGKILDDPMGYIRQHISPVVLNRALEAYDSVKHHRGSRYPIYDKKTGELKYNLTAKQVLQRTFMFPPQEEADKRAEHLSRGMAKYDLMAIAREINDSFIRGDREHAINLLRKYPLARPKLKTLREAAKRRMIPQDKRDRMQRGKARIFYEQGEK